MVITFKAEEAAPAGLTDRERQILLLANQGLSDYRIARKLNLNPPTVCRLHKNAKRKLSEAQADLTWAATNGLDSQEFDDADNPP